MQATHFRENPAPGVGTGFRLCSGDVRFDFSESTTAAEDRVAIDFEGRGYLPGVLDEGCAECLFASYPRHRVPGLMDSEDAARVGQVDIEAQHAAEVVAGFAGGDAGEESADVGMVEVGACGVARVVVPPFAEVGSVAIHVAMVA